MIFFNEGLFWIKTKVKQPRAISQNLDVIKKYAAGWFWGYRYIKINNEAIDKVPREINKFLTPFCLLREYPENHTKNGNNI